MNITESFKSTFRIYSSYDDSIESTIFDLISGDNETKQTKGLAYLMSKDVKLIKRIMDIPDIKNRLKQLLKANYTLMNSIDNISVDAEMISTNSTNKRRDIALSFYSERSQQISKKFLVVVIEAKSIKKKKQDKDEIDIQLGTYLDPKYFSVDGEVPKLGITLTRHKKFDDEEPYSENLKFVRLTWIEIINILHNEIECLKEDKYLKRLLSEYYKFIIGVDKDMRYYEKEILSVPAGETFDLIKKYYIHAFPANKRGYDYKDSLFITFRKKNGGEMDSLYKIEKIFDLNPHGESYIDTLNKSDVYCKERIKGYIECRKDKWTFDTPGDYRFYVLSESEVITLAHKPKPINGNNAGHRYYTLVEILSGKPKINTENNYSK